MATSRGSHSATRLFRIDRFLSKIFEHFLQIAHALSALLGKHVHWRWGTAEKLAFQTLKDALLQAPILKWYDPERSIKLAVDALRTAVGGVLLQQ